MTRLLIDAVTRNSRQSNYRKWEKKIFKPFTGMGLVLRACRIARYLMRSLKSHS